MYLHFFLMIYQTTHLDAYEQYSNFTESINSRLVCKFVLLSICIYHASGDMSLENAEGLISKTETSTAIIELATIPQFIR